MKCKSFVQFIPARKVGSGEHYLKSTKIYPLYSIRLGMVTPNFDMVQCDGDLSVLIEADIDGDCACSSYAVLNIKYKCKKCGSEFFQELPQDSKEISKLVETFLENLPEDQRDRMIDQRESQEIDKMCKESQARSQRLLKPKK